jgi:Skp family chaperone for outer membrane proteins
VWNGEFGNSSIFKPQKISRYRTEGVNKMKNKVVQGILLVLVVLLSYSPMASADPLKIGYFDYKTVIDRSKWGKKAMRQLEQKHKRLKAEVDKKAKEFKKMREELEKKRGMLDEKALAKKLKALQEAKRQGEQKLMQSGAEMRKLEDRLSEPFSKKVAEIVTKIAKKEKYDFIFEMRTAGLFYGSPKDDLTGKIIKELDRSTPK